MLCSTYIWNAHHKKCAQRCNWIQSKAQQKIHVEFHVLEIITSFQPDSELCFSNKHAHHLDFTLKSCKWCWFFFALIWNNLIWTVIHLIAVSYDDGEFEKNKYVWQINATFISKNYIVTFDLSCCRFTFSVYRLRLRWSEQSGKYSNIFGSS